tara:strand:- start:475 stop:678 length:204 start_codon:yes stop_codon:yes gene_type:complete
MSGLAGIRSLKRRGTRIANYNLVCGWVIEPNQFLKNFKEKEDVKTGCGTGTLSQEAIILNRKKEQSP